MGSEIRYQDLDTSKVNKSKLISLNKNSINCFDFLSNNDHDLLVSCCEEEINLFNLKTNSKQCLHTSKEDEIGCFKLYNVSDNSASKNLFSSSGKYLNMFDLNQAKLLNKYKFSKDTINSIELNKANNLLTCGDDSGEIRLIDLRQNPNQTAPSLTLKKTLQQHENICFTLKYHPINEHELFSGSFDCSFIKWDTRFLKASAKKPYLKRVSISETLQNILKKQAEDESDFLISNMTPCFIHCLSFAEASSQSNVLMCGVENGFCMVFNPDTCDFLTCSQLSNNCALTVFDKFEHNLQITGGNSKSIDFFLSIQIKTSKKKKKRRT